VFLSDGAALSTVIYPIQVRKGWQRKSFYSCTRPVVATRGIAIKIVVYSLTRRDTPKKQHFFLNKINFENCDNAQPTKLASF